MTNEEITRKMIENANILGLSDAKDGNPWNPPEQTVLQAAYDAGFIRDDLLCVSQLPVFKVWDDDFIGKGVLIGESIIVCNLVD